MRNKQLDDLLYSLAYDRGHSAGEGEVNMIHESLRSEFKEIDAMLPHTMPPKFKRGDNVMVWDEKAFIVKVAQDINGYSYNVSIPAYDGNVVTVPEDDVKPRQIN